MLERCRVVQHADGYWSVYEVGTIDDAAFEKIAGRVYKIRCGRYDAHAALPDEHPYVVRYASQETSFRTLIEAARHVSRAPVDPCTDRSWKSPIPCESCGNKIRSLADEEER